MIYKEDRIGLKELNEKGGLFRCSVNGSHLSMSDDEIKKMIINFSDHRNNEYKEKIKEIADKCKYVIN